MTSTPAWEELEAIKSLKARYCWCVDTKDWDGLADTLSDEARFDTGLSTDGEPSTMGKAEFVALTRQVLEHATSVHQVLMPRIELIDTTSARGTWAMSDYLDFGAEPGPTPSGASLLRGFAYYHEEYAKEDGQWRITSLSLTRLKLEELQSHAVPDTTETE